MRRSDVGVLIVATATALCLALPVGCSSGSGGGTSNPGPSQAPQTSEPPVSGGTLQVSIVAEADGFLPYTNRWTPSSWMVAKTIFDPLTAVDDQGAAKPYLAESLTPSADFKSWDIKVRPNVTFHNGEKLDAAVVAANLNKSKAAALTGAVLFQVASIEATGPMDVTVKMTQPWATFPQVLAGQVGMIAAPAQIASEDQSAPIGTGPFQFKNWKRDTQLDVTKYSQYWQKDQSGVQLPYLDGVTFHPITDPTAQMSSFEANQIDMLATANAQQISRYEAGGISRPSRSLSSVDAGDENAIVFNTQSGPFTDKNLRVAAATALDRQGLIDTVADSVPTLANGPFTKESKWGESTTYPQYDPAKAKEMVTAYTAAHGGTPPSVSLSIIPGGNGETQAAYIQQQWREAGINTEIKSVSEATFALDVVTGNFDAINFGFWYEVDPDPLYHFLASSSIKDPKAISLNFARYGNPDIDTALQEGRSTADVKTRAAAYQKVWNKLGEDVPILFLYHAKWLVIWQDKVHGVGEMTLPDGSKAAPLIWGNLFLTKTWMSK